MEAHLGRELLFKAQDVASIAARKDSQRYAALFANIRQTADQITLANSLLLPGDTFTIWYYVRNRLMDLSLAALTLGDARHAEALNAVLMDLCNRDLDFYQGPRYPNRPRTIIWNGAELLAGELETAQLAMGLSIAYDWGYALLTEETRNAVQGRLRETLLPLLRNSVGFQSERWVMNHLCVLSAGLLLSALVADSPADIEPALRGLDLWMEKLEDDGSYGEFYHYWAYPTNCLFLGVFAAKTALNRELQNTHRFRQALHWAVYNQCGFSQVQGFDRPIATAINHYDSPWLFQMESPEALLFLRMFDDPLARWYIDQYLLTDPPRPDCLHHVWHRSDALLLALDDERIPSRSPESLSMPSAAYFADTGYVYFRSGWKGLSGDGHDTVFALQSGGGGRSRSHEHYDKNSFSLHAMGEYFVVDPGHSCYRGALHRDYDTRTAAHNTLSIGGANQSLSFLEKGMLHDEAQAHPSYHNQAAIIGRNFAKELSFIASEAGRCYTPGLNGFLRHVWHLFPDLFVVWDHVDAANVEGQIENGLNINNYDDQTMITIEGNDILVQRPLADLQIAYITPQALTFGQASARLHLAYHTLPGQAVEGAEGSAIRLVPQIKGRQYDLIYLLCPLAKGEPPAKIERLEGLSFRIEHGGKTHTFWIQGNEIQYESGESVRYTF